MRCASMIALALSLSSGVAAAQGVAQRVAAIGDGRLELTFAARPSACGDGRNYLEDGFGGRRWTDGDVTIVGDRGPVGACKAGPVRVVATVQGGTVTRLRTFVGPLAPPSSDAPRLALSVKDAVAYLTGLAQQGDGRAANEALAPLVLADSTDPWPLFLRLAGDETRPQGERHEAAFWLSRATTAKLGIGPTDDEDDADEVPKQAVFALSQQPRDVAVPRLLEVAQSKAKPAVRASAVFWLGQSGDQRALAWFGQVLGAP